MNKTSFESSNFNQTSNKREKASTCLKNTLSSSLDHRVYIDKSLPHRHLYIIELLVPQFQPDEIQVKLNENRLSVQARRQLVNQKQLNLKETELFERHIELPYFVLLNTANSYLEQYKNGQNVLVIETVIDEKHKNIDDFERCDLI